MGVFVYGIQPEAFLMVDKNYFTLLPGEVVELETATNGLPTDLRIRAINVDPIDQKR